MVESGQSPETGELADVLDRMGNPEAVTIPDILGATENADFHGWLRDRKNRRAIPHRLEDCGYIAVPNKNSEDGRWRVNGKNVMIYVVSRLPRQERYAAAVRRAGSEELSNILRPSFGDERRCRWGREED
jgi:hypothetical protein